MGFDICVDKIADKIWEFEAYRLQDEIWRTKTEKYDCHTCDEYTCDECGYNNGFFGTAVDCEDCNECDVYDCPHNTRS